MIISNIRSREQRDTSTMQPYENKQDLDLAGLQAELETRYGTAAAQGIMDRLAPKRNITLYTQGQSAPDYMDVKAMSELAERLRAHAMVAVWRLKDWHRTQKPTNPFQKNLVQLEGAMLKRQCQETVKLYRLAHKTYFSMYREALAAFSKPSQGFASYMNKEGAVA